MRIPAQGSSDYGTTALYLSFMYATDSLPLLYFTGKRLRQGVAIVTEERCLAL
jgi:hypothetical protein